MDLIRNGWFSEINNLWPGQAMSIEVEEVLHHERSDYQDVLVFKSKTYGNVLVLDGVIQLTERDEFSYQEMITHLPMFSHPNPQKVLIIGGGDGGVVREVLKHATVEQVVQCEIDKMVIDVSKKYLPSTASCYSNPKLYQHVGDGFAFMREHKNEFDVIITDSSDPDGPAESLFEQPYYELMKAALRPNGIISTQGECMWLHLLLIKKMLQFNRGLFPTAEYGFTTIPTYPSGQIGFMLCSCNPETKFSEPARTITDAEADAMDLKYYSSAVHRAAFVLPRFVQKELSGL
ncbi:spermidine synthase-like [Sycon ciliatum]|uniref:spermidine synthase-like n=1 Tax=Sycon ciliatum TaxID=27933 RepID=UPI0031F6D7ED